MGSKEVLPIIKISKPPGVGEGGRDQAIFLFFITVIDADKVSHKLKFNS